MIGPLKTGAWLRFFFLLCVSAGLSGLLPAAQAADKALSDTKRLQSAFEDLRANPPARLAQKIDAAIDTGWKDEDGKLAEFLELWRDEAEVARSADFKGFFSLPLPNEPYTVRVRFHAIRNLARILLLEGRRSEADGRPDRALNDELLVLRLGHAAGGDKGLVSFLTGVKLWQMAYAPIKDLSGSGAVTEALQEVVRATAPGSLSRPLRQEKEWAIANVKRSLSEEAKARGAAAADAFFARIGDRTTALLTSYFERLEAAAVNENTGEIAAIDREIEAAINGTGIKTADLQNLSVLQRRYAKSPEKLRDDVVNGIAVQRHVVFNEGIAFFRIKSGTYRCEREAL